MFYSPTQLSPLILFLSYCTVLTCEQHRNGLSPRSKYHRFGMRRLPLLVSLLFWLLGLVYRRIDGFKPTNELRRRFIRCFELNTYARMMAVLGQERGQKGGRGRAGVKHIDRYAYLPSIYQLCFDRLEWGERGGYPTFSTLSSKSFIHVCSSCTYIQRV